MSTHHHHGADGHDHDHDHHHHDNHYSDMQARVRALETVADGKGADRSRGPRRHCRDLRNAGWASQRGSVVARAWAEPEFADWLKRDATAAIASMGFTGRQGEHMRAVFNYRGDA